MEYKRTFLVLSCQFLSIMFFGQAPLPASMIGDPFNNPVILSHYSIEDLKQLSDKKLAAVTYYYTGSFLLDSIPCNECRAFNRSSFDVSQFEQFRKQNQRYVREYTKYGYRLTLLSKDELLYPSIR